MQRICSNMFKLKDDDTDLAKDMKKHIGCDLQRRYSDPKANQLLSVCSFLDPQFNN